MKLTGHSKYPFTIDNGYLNFRDKGEYGPPFSERGPKLYIVSSGGRPIYVGAATIPIKDRLSNGIKPSSKYRYLWSRFPLEELTVDVWIVRLNDQDIETMNDDPNMQLAMNHTINKEPQDIILETVEGEVVNLIRQSCEQWPKYQMEIHFHQSHSEHLEIAERIFDDFRSQQCPIA